MAPYLPSELPFEGLVCVHLSMCLLIHHPCFLLDITVVIGCFGGVESEECDGDGMS